MKLFLLAVLCICLATITLPAQDTIFYNSSMKEVKTSDKAAYYAFKIRDKDQPEFVIKKVYYMSDSIQSQERYSILSPEKRDGKYYEWYENGQLSEETDYLNGKSHGKSLKYWESGQLKAEINYEKGSFHGNLRTYWENGQLKRQDIYENDELIKGETWDSTGQKTPYKDYYILPQYPGGIDAAFSSIFKNIKYPSAARENNIEGTVHVQFVVDKEGNIRDIVVLKGVHPSLNAEAIRVVKLLKNWRPGYQDGEAVDVYYNIPIKFKLN